MPTHYIRVDYQGAPVDHIPADEVSNPLTSPKGTKDYYVAATLNDVTPNALQIRTGPVYDVQAGTITYSLQDITPQAVTPLQARKALRDASMKSAVDTWLATQAEEVQEAWDYALEVRRDDPTVLAAQSALELTDTQMDDLFKLAITL